MRVLVTGATGFVGRALVPALMEHGHTVRAALRGGATAPFHPHVEIARHGDLAGDVDWTPIVAGVDAIVHLAGIAHIGTDVPEARYDRINHQVTEDLAVAAEGAQAKRFIFVSSIRAQSGPSADHILSEKDAPQPADIYGVSKLAAEGALHNSALRYTILRPVLIYGAGVKGNLAALTRLAASSWPLPFGALTNKRSMLNRDSLISAILFALDTPATERETYVVADKTPIAVNEIVTALRHGLAKSPGLIAVPRGILSAGLRAVGKSDVLSRLEGELIANPSKLIAAGWTPTTDTAAALMAIARSMLRQ
jgi:UDP-glucose 4-epimerase